MRYACAICEWPVTIYLPGFLFLPFCEWLSLRKIVLSNFWNCLNHLVAVVYFHYRLLLDFRNVFVEIKLPIFLYYWITYFFIRGDEKFSFFRPVKAIVKTDAANSMTSLQREFLPSNDTRELKMETFSGRRRPDWQRKPGTEAAVASHQKSNIKIEVNSEGRRL